VLRMSAKDGTSNNQQQHEELRRKKIAGIGE
jgi:hypothetical protein